MKIDPVPVLREVVADVLAGVGTDRVAARFHNWVVKALVSTAAELAQRHGVRRVALSGGSVQNGRLRHGLTKGLADRGIETLVNRIVPVNDGGVSLGQAVAAGL